MLFRRNKPENSRDKKIEDIAAMFREFESQYLECGDSLTTRTIARLSEAIPLGQEVIRQLDIHKFGYIGGIKHQTLLYLKMAYGKRADCHWMLGYVLKQDTKYHCRAAIADYDRSVEVLMELLPSSLSVDPNSAERKQMCLEKLAELT